MCMTVSDGERVAFADCMSIPFNVNVKEHGIFEWVTGKQMQNHSSFKVLVMTIDALGHFETG